MKKRNFSLVIPVGRPDREAEMTRQVAGLAYPAHRVELLFIRGENNPSSKRNQGARQARHDYLVFLDDDLHLPADLLSKLDHILEDGAAVVGGANIGFKTGNALQKVTDAAFSSPFGFGKGHVRFKNSGTKRPGCEDNLTACLLCIKKDVFFKAGGFDHTLYPGEEVDLIRGLKDKGVPMSFNPGWFVYHQRRDTLRGLCSQIYRYGRARVKIWEKQRFLLADVSYLFPLVLMIYLLLLPGTLFLGIWAFAGVFLYLFILAAAAVMTVIPGNLPFRNLALLGITLAAIHVSYGLGMMKQLLNGLNLTRRAKKTSEKESENASEKGRNIRSEK